MSENDSTLILSAKDASGPAFDKIRANVVGLAGDLDKLSLMEGTQGKTADKMGLSLGNLAAKYNLLSTSVNKETSSLSDNYSAAVRATKVYSDYTASVQRAAAATLEYNSASAAASTRAKSLVVAAPSGGFTPAISETGRSTTSASAKGSFVSAADTAEAKRYAAALTEMQAASVGATGALGALNGEAANVDKTFTAMNTVATHPFAALVEGSTATRHAINDASNAALKLGTGLLALPVISAVIATDYQKDFASVQRALLAPAGQSAALESQLINLSKTTPLTFKALTQIAAAGGQMGIAAKDIIPFTKTVAELTLTTNVSAVAAENFIRKFQLIAGVGASQFANLTSALLNVGIHTGATEATIAAIATQIVGIGKVAGFTVPQVIGLSAAIGSISAQGPTLARGAVTRFITQIQSAVTTGGPALIEFAKVAGVSTDKVKESFGNAKFAPVFQSFITGLNKVQQSSGDANTVLAQLGITSVRDVPLFLNLAAAHKLLGVAMADANAGYKDAGILSQHYSIISDTLKSKITDLTNNFGALANQVGTAAIPVLTKFVNGISDAITGIEKFGQTSFGGGLLQFVTIAAAALGGALLLVGGMGKVAVAVLAVGKSYDDITTRIAAYQAATVEAEAATGGLAAEGGLMDLAFGPVGITIAAVAAAIGLIGIALNAAQPSTVQMDVAMTKLGSSYKSFVATTTSGDGVDNFLELGSETSVQHFNNLNKSLQQFAANGNRVMQVLENDSIFDFETEMNQIGTRLSTLSQTNLPAAQNQFDELAAKTDGSKLALSRLLNIMPDYKAAIDKMITANGGVVTSQHEIALATGASTDKYAAAKVAIKDATGAQAQLTTQLSKDLGDASTKQIDDLIAGYQKSVSSLIDLNSVVSQVQGNLKTASDAAVAAGKKGATTTNAQVAAAQKASDAAALKTEQSAKASAATLTGSAKTVADAQATAAYAASKSADAQVAANGKISASNKGVYDGTTVSLQQLTLQYQANNKAQIAWAANLAFVARTYGQDAANQFIQAGYSATNASILAQLTTAAPTQAKAYIAANKEAAALASKAMAEVMIDVANVVSNTGTSLNAAQVKMFGDMVQSGYSVRDALTAVGAHIAGLKIKTPPADTSDTTKSLDWLFTHYNSQYITIPVKADTSKIGGQIASALSGIGATITGIPAKGPGGATGGLYNGNGFHRGFSEGGFTGAGAKYKPAGLVHAGEFVFTKEATSSIGVSNLYGMMQAASSRGYANGGAVAAPVAAGGGTVTVQLSPYDRALLAAAGNVQLVLTGGQLASVNGQQNVIASNRRAG